MGPMSSSPSTTQPDAEIPAETPVETTVSPWDDVSAASLLEAAAEAGHTLDAEQLEAIEALAAPHARGVYLHGAVGRGKSWLADRVLAQIAAPTKRLHVHGFLKELQHHMAVQQLPLPEAVSALIGDARFLLLDEFHVHDIADAIMLRRTLVTLLDGDTALLMTSNYPPERLLPNPSFHDAVLPAIEAIEEHLETVHLGGEHDYREQSEHTGGFASGSWRVGEAPSQAHDVVQVSLSATRSLNALAAGEGTLRVSWDELCYGNVSVGDYLTLARDFERFELLGVPNPQFMDPEPFQRLAYLLDVLVDADRPLDVWAATGREAFATAMRRPRDVERLTSRLQLLREG
jgi:cell division protein ZapE